MSHRHFCPATNHYWDCDGTAIRFPSEVAQPSACMCPTHPDVSVDEGDHSTCSIEVLACSGEHQSLYQKYLDETSVDLEEILTRGMDAAEQLKFEREHLFMEQEVFAGLTNSNTEIDSPLCFYFSPEEFSKLIDRCERSHVSISCIEVFSTDVKPPWRAALLDIEYFPGEDLDWARRLVKRYQNVPHIILIGDYNVPDSMLESSGVSSDPDHSEKWQIRALALETWSKRKRLEMISHEGEIGTQ